MSTGQRVTRACDFCHRRSLKCRQSTSETVPVPTTSYDTCVKYKVVCTQTRQAKKRGRKFQPNRETIPVNTVDCRAPTWGLHQEESGNPVMLTSLFNTYLDTVHPNYAIPSGNVFDSDWQRRMKLADAACYVLLMAICALSARHIEAQAFYTKATFDVGKVLSSETYLLESVQAIPFRLNHCKGLDYIIAFGRSALCAIQQGNYSALYRYPGLYHALVAQHGFHDESRWPQGLTEGDVDVRRRVYWCMYRLEVHSACILGHMVRVSEPQASVLYPLPAISAESDEKCLVGWNLDADLYRLLEHALLRFQAKRSLLAPVLRLTTLTDLRRRSRSH